MFGRNMRRQIVQFARFDQFSAIQKFNCVDIRFISDSGTFAFRKQQHYFLLNVWKDQFLKTDQNNVREFFGEPLA